MYTHVQSQRPKQKRVAVRKTAEEIEFMKEYQARFSYAKNAKKRPYDPKDTVVPDTTFFCEDGVTYNTYM